MFWGLPSPQIKQRYTNMDERSNLSRMSGAVPILHASIHASVSLSANVKPSTDLAGLGK